MKTEDVMSFSEQCKIELWEEEPPKKPCCRRALAMGLLFGAEQEGGVFRLRLSGEELGPRVAVFLEKQLHTTVELTEGNHVGRPYIALSLWARAMYAQFQRADMSDLPLSRLLGFDCEACTRYFLRGAFIAIGSVTDPTKTRQLQFSCRDSATARRLSEVLGEAGVPPRTVRRENGTQLYYKNSAAMEDLFSYLHAHKTLFALINNKIERDIRNDENRATNCVAQNIQKAVRAAAEQTEAIETLKGSREWDKLSEAVRETALLRLANPDATLSELASLHNPPITKSGLNHRLKKLTELAIEVTQKN
jgi:DNA-binding transcriptional regulator WhiA